MLSADMIRNQLRNQRAQRTNMFSVPIVLDARFGVVVRLTAPLPHAASVQIGLRSIAPGTHESAFRIVHIFREDSAREITLSHPGGPCEWKAVYSGETLPAGLDVTFTAAEEPVRPPAPPSLEERVASLEREAG